MKNNKFDSTLVDKAIIFAVNAHKNTERRGKGFPYIVHPMEVLSICSTMTNDSNLLCAAILHDTIEDTGVTKKEIQKEFNKKIADLVVTESDTYIDGEDEETSWKRRKKEALDRLSKSSKEGKIVALSDKLSNLRTIYNDYTEQGEKVFEKFHVSDPCKQEWYYRGLAKSLSELKDTNAYKEYVSLLDKVFHYIPKEFSFSKKGNTLKFKGKITAKDITSINKYFEGEMIKLDFTDVSEITYGAIRNLLHLSGEHKLYVSNASKEVAHLFFTSSANKVISITEKPEEINLDDYEVSGDGYTAISYFSKDNDTMMKLYEPFISLEAIEQEKRIAQEAFLLGVNTPLSGKIVKCGGKYGISFERIQNKISIARALANNPQKVDDLARILAEEGTKLHKLECNTNIFPNAKTAFIEAVNKVDLKDRQKKKILNFIDNIPNKTTCVHGDFHMGNVIINDKGDRLFIDMGDFSYGSPLFDIGMLYFACHTESEERSEQLYHTNNAVLNNFWIHFVKYYFGVKTPEDLKRVEDLVSPFAGLKLIYFAARGGKHPWMDKVIKEWLLDKIK